MENFTQILATLIVPIITILLISYYIINFLKFRHKLKNGQIVTNHDFQTEFGISGNKSIIDDLRGKLHELKLEDYEEMYY